VLTLQKPLYLSRKQLKMEENELAVDYQKKNSDLSMILHTNKKLGGEPILQEQKENTIK